MGTSTQYVKSETSNLPDYAQPYYTNLMQRSQALLTQPYTPYGQERIAGFTPEQKAVQQGVAGMQTPGQFGQASTLLGQAGLGSLAAGNYNPAQFNAANVSAQSYSAPQMRAAQTNYNPNLQYFQMQGPQTFDTAQAQRYMSPYMEAALEPQRRQAVLDAKRGQLAANLGAARQGTYGGSGELISSMERERNLGQQLGDIESRGRQAAYEQAMQQFNADQASQQAAGRANLEARLGVQQLGTQTGLQAALANLSSEQQANVQNQAAMLQQQGLNQQQALQAALANQQYGLEAQRLGEQSRQFGAQQGLQAYSQAGQIGQTLGNIGSMQQQADISRYGLQGTTAAQQQALQQQYLDTAYQDFIRQRDYPLEMLQQYSSMLRGVPVTPSSTTTAYAPAPSLASQLLGTGLGALGMYNTMKGPQ